MKMLKENFDLCLHRAIRALFDERQKELPVPNPSAEETMLRNALAASERGELVEIVVE